MWDGMTNGYGWGWGWPGFVHMGLWWIFLVIAIIVLVRVLSNSSHKAAPPVEDSALEILKKRYARGEINKEEFEQKKRDLGA